MGRAGERIIKGLEDALAYARGDKSRATTTVFIRRRCGCCDKEFLAPKGTDPIFCKACDGDGL